MTAKNNSRWLYWSWDGVPYGPKSSPHSVLKYHVNLPSKRKSMSYREELYWAAEKMRQDFTGKFDVFLSGGTDSDVVVRVFRDLGIEHNTIIVRYENDYNYRDVAEALELCNSLNLKYKIIDFNLQKFFETEAVDWWNKTLNPLVGKLPHLKFVDLVDGIPILGDGESYWKRTLGADYSRKSDWYFIFTDTHHLNEMYLYQIGRENILSWYEYTPYLIESFAEHSIIQDLINDNIKGKQSSWSSRAPIHQEIWPDFRYKQKLIGYEGNNLPGYMPPFITQFQNWVDTFGSNKNEFRYTWPQLQQFLNP